MGRRDCVSINEGAQYGVHANYAGNSHCPLASNAGHPSRETPILLVKTDRDVVSRYQSTLSRDARDEFVNHQEPITSFVRAYRARLPQHQAQESKLVRFNHRQTNFARKCIQR